MYIGIICFPKFHFLKVTFHDAAVHHPLHVANHHGHTMADLTAEAAVFACEANEDELSPSRSAIHQLLNIFLN
jgi:hypothetical protein